MHRAPPSSRRAIDGAVAVWLCLGALGCGSSEAAPTPPPSSPAPAPAAPQAPPPTTAAAPTPPPTAAPADDTTRVEIVLEPQTNESPDDDTPRSAVRVVVRRGAETQRIDVGVLNNCAVSEQTSAGSLATLQCWWAGGGDTIEVASRDGAVVVTRQEAEEGQDDFPVREVGRAAAPPPVELVRPAPAP